MIACALFPMAAHCGEIRLADKGFLIDADTAGTYILGYPRLLKPNDQGLFPEAITVRADGTGATMAYAPSGKLSIEKQSEGGWFFRFTEIPEDRVKFAFTTAFQPEMIGQGASWSFDGSAFKPFPATKGEVRLHAANPATFAFKKGEAGFVLTYPRKTFTMLTDQRVYGKPYFNLGHILYFPGKKHVPAIDYSLKIELLSANR